MLRHVGQVPIDGSSAMIQSCQVVVNIVAIDTPMVEESSESGEVWDVVVVGAGISGLTAAYRLLQARPTLKVRRSSWEITSRFFFGHAWFSIQEISDKFWIPKSKELWSTKSNTHFLTLQWNSPGSGFRSLPKSGWPNLFCAAQRAWWRHDWLGRSGELWQHLSWFGNYAGQWINTETQEHVTRLVKELGINIYEQFHEGKKVSQFSVFWYSGEKFHQHFLELLIFYSLRWNLFQISFRYWRMRVEVSRNTTALFRHCLYIHWLIFNWTD